MDMEQVEAIVKEVGARYADQRVNVFEVSVAQGDGEAVRLIGKVLEAGQREEVLAAVGAGLPEVAVDASELVVVRQSPPRVMSVAANLGSMHNGTSFIAEQVTQLLNGMQVEILWEQGRWGYARKWNDAADHYQGWTYLPYLEAQQAPAATHLVMAPVGLLRQEPEMGAGLVTRVLGGTVVAVTEHQGGWACLALAGGSQGWLAETDLRALDALPTTAEARRKQMVQDAFSMIGVPYLWGGCSANGIDCSGLAQLVHRWVGIALPRDADMQYAAGKNVPVGKDTASEALQPGDLLFFGEQGERRRITHVGISLGGWRIIHSSRSRNGVHVDDVQAVEGLRQSFLCAATHLG